MQKIKSKQRRSITRRDKECESSERESRLIKKSQYHQAVNSTMGRRALRHCSQRMHKKTSRALQQKAFQKNHKRRDIKQQEASRRWKETRITPPNPMTYKRQQDGWTDTIASLIAK